MSSIKSAYKFSVLINSHNNMKFQIVCISYLFKYDQGNKVLLLDHTAKDFDQVLGSTVQTE